MRNIGDNVLKVSLDEHYNKRNTKKRRLEKAYYKDLAHIEESINAMCDIDDSEKKEMLVVSRKKLFKKYNRGICLNDLFVLIGVIFSLLFFPAIFIAFNNFTIGVIFLCSSLAGSFYFGLTGDSKATNCACNKCLMKELGIKND